MYQKLFHITLVLFLVIVSVIMLGLVVVAVLSAMPSSSPMLARGSGIVFVVGGVNLKTLGYMIVAASLVIAGFYLFFRRRRFR